MQKTFKILIVLCLIVSSASFLSCSRIEDVTSQINNAFFDEELADSAVETVETFFDLIIKKDYESAYRYIEKKDQKGLEDFKAEFRDVTDITTLEINWVEVKNNIAEVGIDIMDTYDGDEKIYKDLVVSLIRKEDSDWKIVFWD